MNALKLGKVVLLVTVSLGLIFGCAFAGVTLGTVIYAATTNKLLAVAAAVSTVVGLSEGCASFVMRNAVTLFSTSEETQ